MDRITQLRRVAVSLLPAIQLFIAGALITLALVSALSVRIQWFEDGSYIISGCFALGACAW